MTIEYEDLDRAYNDAQCICDPIDFVSRQKRLLYTLAKYVIERDKPPKVEEDEDDC
jgi:hypothetical protein